VRRDAFKGAVHPAHAAKWRPARHAPALRPFRATLMLTLAERKRRCIDRAARA
jgi:hypothetical protein